MNKHLFKLKLFLLMLLITSMAKAQVNKITGRVTNALSKEPLPGAVITVRETSEHVVTDEQGRFVMYIVSGRKTFTLVITYVGYTKEERIVKENAEEQQIELNPDIIWGQEIVIAASRSPEPISESPVSIERINGSAVKNTPGLSYYDALGNLKGVEMSTQSLTFKTLNTRGFNSDGNYRFNQFVDGMDNMAPGLNFPVGNIVGISDLDLDNAELLPGASSALYGSGGTNGTLLLTSKAPFKYPGISFQYKTGINHVNDDNSSVQPLNQVDLRLARSWQNKLGIKVSFSYLKAHDWIAGNTSNYDRVSKSVKSGDRNTDPNYDGVNVYGDEVTQNMRNVAQAVLNAGQYDFIKQYSNASGGALPSQSQINDFLITNPQTAPFYAGLHTPGLLPNESVSRTGYHEKDLADYNAQSLKTSAALYYKFTNSITGIAQINWGRGTTLYSGSDRYALRNFSIGQYKLELKSDDFFVRAYTTQERSGDSYITSILGSYINEQSKSSQAWFPEYVGNFIGAKLTPGVTDAQASTTAREAADKGRYEPGTNQFKDAKTQIMNSTISSGTGAKFNDRTNLFHYEAMYNFSNLLSNIVDLQVGSSYRVYELRSGGTIFDDLNRKINIGEFGAFAAIGKKLFRDRLKLSLAGRYDKNENFDGRITPRLTAVYTVADHNHIRVSYQTGYRNPTTQNQYLDLAAGGGALRLIGGLPEMLNKYQLYTNKPFTAESYTAFLASASQGTPDQSLLKPFNFNPKGVLPESVQSIELGDRAELAPNLSIDAYIYYNAYKNFISEVEVYQNNGGDFTSFNVPINVYGNVKAYGSAAGLDYSWKGYKMSTNISYNNIGNHPPTYASDYGFNTPKIRFNLGAGNENIYKNIGFNVAYRWQGAFHWSTPFVAGHIPAYGTVDGQVNLKIPSLKSIVKVGGTNLLNKYYTSSFGDPAIGGLYYISYGYNL